MEFILNGSAREYSGDPDLPLLTYLRLHEGITSAKNGCAPQAACGACTVELNGKAVLSCVTPMKKVAGGAVMTIEGLGAYRQDIYANAFAANDPVSTLLGADLVHRAHNGQSGRYDHRHRDQSEGVGEKP